MGLWSNTAAAASRPKNYSEDGNASGNNGALKDIVTNEGGWALAPGLAASGNDNTAANPEILIAISGLQGGVIGGTVNVRSIGWTDGAYADGATFDITVNFEEPVDITSAAATGDQVITNKAYILLSRIGATDMVEDNTIAAQYYSGSGTNSLVFRGVLQAANAGYIGFNGDGVGDDATSTGIIFNGTSALDREDGTSVLGIKQEGTAGSDGQDAIVLDGTDGAGANAGDEMLVDAIDFTVEGEAATTSDITGVTKTGADTEIFVGLLEDGTEGNDGDDTIIFDATDGSLADFEDRMLAETGSSDIAVFEVGGSTSGTASVLNGVTTT
jgi:hypothetical protein